MTLRLAGEQTGSPARRGAAALVLVSAALVLGACGDDDESTPTGTTGPNALEATEVAPPPAGPESEPDGGISSDQPTDPDAESVGENAPGGAGDEANDPIDGGGSSGGIGSDGSGGGGSGGGGSGGGGSGGGDSGGGDNAKDNFDQFCDENPEACE